MRCGKCGSSGPDITVAHVRDCYSGKVTMSDKFIDSGLEKVSDGPTQPPSEAQVKYLLSLQEDRHLPEGYAVKTEAEVWLMEKPSVSASISMLTFCQRKTDGASRSPASGAPTSREWKMPAGRYALLHHEYHDPGVNADIATGYTDSSWRFYLVDKPSEGRWKGYTFIKRLIGQPGDYKRIDVPKGERMDLLKKIEADPLKAMIDFGKHSEHCGKCGAALSNDDKPGPDGLTSIKRGIGPVCAAKMGMY